MKKIHHSPASLCGLVIESLFRGWTAFILALGLIAAFVGTSSIKLVAIAPVIMAIGVLIVSRFKVKQLIVADKYWNRAGIFTVGLVSFATIVWALRFDSIQISDFGVYFKCGNEAYKGIEQSILACQSNYLHNNLIYWTRSLLYSKPIGMLVGANYFAFKLFNAALHIGTTIIWFFGLRHYHGPRVAVVGSVILSLYPEWWFTITLMTPDNAAIFFTVAFLLLLPRLEQQSGSIFVPIGLAITMFASNQLRTIGPVLAATLIFWIILPQFKKWNPEVAVRGTMALVIYVGLNAILSSITSPYISEPVQFLKILSAVDFSSTQDFSVDYPWYEHFWLAIPSEWRDSVASQKIFLELTYGLNELPLYLYRKASILFSGTGYYGFSSFHFEKAPDAVFPVSASTVPFVPALLPWLGAFVTFCLTLGIFSVIRAKLEGPALAALLWVSLFSAMILGFGQVQPRYSVIIAPAISLLAAIVLFPKERITVTALAPSANRITMRAGMGFMLIAAIFCMAVMFFRLSFSSHPAFATQAKISFVASPECNSQGARIEASFRRIRIFMPKGTECATVVLPFGDTAGNISFFVSGGKFPFPFEPRVRSSYSYEINAGGERLMVDSLDFSPVKWYRLDIRSKNSMSEIAIMVKRINRDEDGQIDFSVFTVVK